MTTDKATATAWVRDLAADRWDAALAGHGFARAANSVVYTRKVADRGRQRIHLDLRARLRLATHGRLPKPGPGDQPLVLPPAPAERS